MSTTPAPTLRPALMTAEELIALPDDVMGELVDGVFLPMTPAGGPHGSIATRLTAMLGSVVYSSRLGELFDSSTGFVLRRRPDTVRSPDLAFVVAARLPDGVQSGYLELAPDLAVEIISPSNSAREMSRKLGDYLHHGVRLVWIIDPDERTVDVHGRGHFPLRLREADVLEGGDVIPAFAMPVATLFAGLVPQESRATD